MHIKSYTIFIKIMLDVNSTTAFKLNSSWTNKHGHWTMPTNRYKTNTFTTRKPSEVHVKQNDTFTESRLLQTEIKLVSTRAMTNIVHKCMVWQTDLVCLLSLLSAWMAFGKWYNLWFVVQLQVIARSQFKIQSEKIGN